MKSYHYTMDEFFLDNGHKKTPLWSLCVEIRRSPNESSKMLEKKGFLCQKHMN